MKGSDRNKIPAAPVVSPSEEHLEKNITKLFAEDIARRAKLAKYGMSAEHVVCDWETWNESVAPDDIPGNPPK